MLHHERRRGGILSRKLSIVFSCYRSTRSTQVLGPKYHPLKAGAWRHASPLGDGWVSPPPHTEEQSTSNRHYTRRDTGESGGIDGDSETGGGVVESRQAGRNSVALFMMMGSALQPVSRVPAGNVLALAGLEGMVNKCATLTDTPECPAMRVVTLQVSFPQGNYAAQARPFICCVYQVNFRSHRLIAHRFLGSTGMPNVRRNVLRLSSNGRVLRLRRAKYVFLLVLSAGAFRPTWLLSSYVFSRSNNVPCMSAILESALVVER